MANIRKKIINTWDGGIQTSSQDSNPETSFGCQQSKHFDVYTDPRKLIPMPAWEDFTTTAEKAYNIRAIGGFSDTIYGLGKGTSNWYSADWQYRVKLTVAEPDAVSGLPFWVDLSNMPAGFWSNTQSTGADIRVTSSNGVTGLPFEVENFNQAGNTGDLWVDGVASGTELYVYYGNATVSAIQDNSLIPFSNQPSNVWDSSGMRFAFSFPEDFVNNNDQDEEFDTEIADVDFVTGLVGKSITTGETSMKTNDSDEVALSSNDISFSFTINVEQAPSSDLTLFEDINGTWSIVLTPSREIKFFVNGTVGNTTVTSTATLTLATDYVVDCVFDADHHIYINGVVETFDSNDGNYDDNVTNNELVVLTKEGSSNICKIGQFWGFNSDITQAQVTSKYKNFTDNSNFWTIGAEEDQDNITLNYSGIQIYTKLISSGDWTEYMQANQPVKTLSNFAVNGFVELSGGDVYFIASQTEENGGFTSLGKTSSFDVIDAQHLLLNTIPESVKIAFTADSPVDKSIYFTHASTDLGEVGDPGLTGAFSAYGQIEDIAPWRNYLALVSNRRNRGLLEIWDTNATTLDVADTGSGNVRVVGNTQDVLFTVTDNFIDDAVKSSAQPTVELKRYVGNGRMEEEVTIEVPVNYTGWVDQWERAVSNFSFRREDETLFYAKIPTGASTFDEGFWAVGLNSQGKLALTLLLDTSDIGDTPENVHGFAKQVFFVEKDGGIRRLSTSDAYTKTSNYKTLKMNEGNTEIEKALKGIELVTEPLEAGQTWSVYYKKDGDASRTKIADFTGEGEVSFEAVVLPDETYLPHYKEIEFEIESTGGKAAALEFNYKYEYTSDIV